MNSIALNNAARIDLNLTTTFLAVWQERSVSKAAVRLGLSQSAVSGALARLRDAVGDPLFVRTSTTMEPTPRAIEIAPLLERALAQLGEALTPKTAFDPATIARAFTIGMSDDFMLACGPAFARRVAVEAPAASVIFRQCNSQTVEAMLEAREVDVAMVAAPRLRSRVMRHEDIGSSDYRCLVDPAAIGKTLPLTLDAYLGLPHVLVSYSGQSGIVDQALKGIGRQRQVMTALTQFAALPSFLLGVAAVATLPGHAAVALARVSRLQTFVPPIALDRYRVSLAWRSDMDADPPTRWVRTQLQMAWAGQHPA